VPLIKLTIRGMRREDHHTIHVRDSAIIAISADGPHVTRVTLINDAALEVSETVEQILSLMSQSEPLLASALAK